MRKAILKERGVIMFRKNASASIYSDKSFPDRTLYGSFGFSMQVEVKREGEEADENQAKLHKAMRDAGHIVYVLDNTPDLIAAYRKEYMQWLLEKPSSKAAAELRKLETLWGVRRKPSAPASRRGSRVSTKA